MKWKMKNGKEIKISKMTDSHLVNTYLMLKEKGFISQKDLHAYLHCEGPTGDIAQYCFQQEQDHAFNSPVSPHLDVIEREIDKRGLQEEVDRVSRIRKRKSKQG